MTKTEERLRAAVHDYADSVVSDPGAWGAIEDRIRSARRRRVGLVAAAAAVTVVAIVAVVVRIDADDDVAVRTTASAELPPYVPPEIVAVTDDGRIVVLETATGDEVRELADGADEATRLSISRDTEMVFFDRPNADESDRDGFVVPVDGGDVSRAGGTLPAVTPDGTRLASYHHRSGRGIVTVEEIPSPSGESVPFVRGSALVGDDVSSVDLLSWQPNTRELAIIVSDAAGRQRVHVLDPEGNYNVPLDESNMVAVPEGLTVLGFIDVADNMFGWSCVDGEVEVVTFSTERGDVYPQSVLDRTVACEDAPSGVDAYNLSYLVVEGDVVHRWSSGDAGMTRVGDGVRAAVWVPRIPEPPMGLDPGTLEGCVADHSSMPFGGAFDHGAQTVLPLTVEEFCEMLTAVEPAYSEEELRPVGIAWQPVLLHGQFEVRYVELIEEISEDGNVFISTETDIEVPFEEVVRRVEAARSEE